MTKDARFSYCAETPLVVPANRMQTKLREYSIDLLIILVISLIFFANTAGLDVLRPENSDWLASRGDAYSHYIGLGYFLQDRWRFPLALNPMYGLHNSSSLAYTDSIPLLGITAKLLLGRVSHIDGGIQLFGIYILISLYLLFACGYLCMRFFSLSRIESILGAVLIGTIPIPIWRLLPSMGHVSLVAIFSILLSFLVYALHRPEGIFARSLPVIIGFGLHPYLGIMTYVLWISSAFDIFMTKPVSLIKDIITVNCILAVFLYLYGYFGFEFEAVQSGYGAFGFNLASFINPSIGCSQGTLLNTASFSSFISSSVYCANYEKESFSYYGLGLLAAISMIPLLHFAFQARRLEALHAGLSFAKRRVFLITAILCMLLISITHEIKVGDSTFYLADRVYINTQIIEFLGNIRASSRFAWPALYGLPLLALGSLGHLSNQLGKTGKSAIIVLLAVILAIQLKDVSSGHKLLKQSFRVDNRGADHHELVSFFKKHPFQGAFMLEDLRKSNEYIQIADAAMNAGIPTNIIDSPRTIKEQGLISAEQIVGAYGADIVLVQILEERMGKAPVGCPELIINTNKKCQEKKIGKFTLTWLSN